MTVGTKAPNIAINLRGKEVITIATEAISQTVFVILDGRAQFYYLHTTYYPFFIERREPTSRFYPMEDRVSTKSTLTFRASRTYIHIFLKQGCRVKLLLDWIMQFFVGKDSSVVTTRKANFPILFLSLFFSQFSLYVK
jgi:hypothetical protein